MRVSSKGRILDSQSSNASSILVARTYFFSLIHTNQVKHAELAQLVERMPEEHGVDGSTPSLGTICSCRPKVGHRIASAGTTVRIRSAAPFDDHRLIIQRMRRVIYSNRPVSSVGSEHRTTNAGVARSSRARGTICRLGTAATAAGCKPALSEFEGSSPSACTNHPRHESQRFHGITDNGNIAIHAPLAQLDRAADFESVFCSEFESRAGHHHPETCPSWLKELAWKARGRCKPFRWFESSRLRHERAPMSLIRHG